MEKFISLIKSPHCSTLLVAIQKKMEENANRRGDVTKPAVCIMQPAAFFLRTVIRVANNARWKKFTPRGPRSAKNQKPA
jgi:hypothetical protein